MAKKNHTGNKTTKEKEKESHWKIFEKVVFKIFKTRYSRSKIEFVATTFTRDGGRDAQATWFIDENTPGNSTIDSPKHTIWVEAKFRTKKKKIGFNELASNTLKALRNKNVHTFYFVTNRDFTANAKEEIPDILERFHCEVDFINNQRIVNEILGMERDATTEDILNDLKELPGFEDCFPIQGSKGVVPKWQINGCFQKNLSAKIRSEPPGTIVLHYNQVFFMILEIESCSSINKQFPELKVIPKSGDKVNIFLYKGENQSTPGPQIKGLKKIYAVFPRGSGKILFVDFDISLQGINRDLAALNLEGSVYVREGLKFWWAPSSWKSVSDRLYNRFNQWYHNECPGYLFNTLIGAAGYGKSFIVQHLINDAVKNHVLPMVIDGEYSKSPVEFARKLLDWVFPINKVFDCDEQTRAALLKFLTARIGLREDVFRKFLNWLSNDWQKKTGETVCLPGSDYYLSRGDLSQICSLLVRVVADQSCLLFIVEDLHKIDPDTISLLIAMHRTLQEGARGNIFFLWTSRREREKSPEIEIFYESNDKDNSWDHWFRHLMNSKGNNQLQIILKCFRKEEACRVLWESIDSLTGKEAEWLVDHVGRSPYDLKEGLLFIESKDTIQRRDDEDGFRMLFPGKLWDKISPRDLEEKAKNRVNAARNHSSLLRDLIDHAACLGRHFNIKNIKLVLHVMDAQNEDEIDSVLKYSEKFDILSISHQGPGFWEFNHDLLRDVIIDTMSTSRHQSVARHLLTCVPPEELTPWQQASLWFQAGDAQKVLDLTYPLVYGQRPAPEVLKAALLRFLVTDRLGEWDMVNYIPFIGWDEAIRADRAPHRPVTPAEDTEEMLKAAEVIFDKLQILSSTACRLWGKLSVVCMLAAQSIPDEKKRALFKHYRGRFHFDKMEFEEALNLFRECEDIFLNIKDDIHQPPPDNSLLEKLLFSKNVNKKLIKEWFKKDKAAAERKGHRRPMPVETNSNQKLLQGVQGAPWHGGPIRDGFINEDGFDNSTSTRDLHLSPLAEKSPPGSRRQENLLFLSFCYRHLDLPEKCKTTMRKALALRQPGEWPIIGRVLANAGALYLHSDLELTRLYWQRGYDFMKVCDIPGYWAEFSINLGHLDILKNRFKSAEEHLEEGKKIAEKHHLMGEKIRYLIHKGCLALLQGATPESILYFEKAFNYASMGEHFRRIWRIRANLATAYEMKGDIREAARYDELAVLCIAPIVHRGESSRDTRLLWKITRASCALGNIGLRAREYPDVYQPLLAKLDQDHFSLSREIADAVSQGNIKAKPGGPGVFLKTINGTPRFLVTD